MRMTRRSRGTLFLLSRLFFLVAALEIGVTSFAIAAPPLTAETLVEQLNAISRPVRPSLGRIVMTVRNNIGEEEERWVADVARKQFADGPRTLIVLQEPKELQNNAFLIGQRSHGDATLWLSTPAFQRVRGITPIDAYERFLRTDFTYSDLGLAPRRSAYRFLGEEQRNGAHAYKLEEAPQDQGHYSRILTWLATDSLLPLRREYYDRAGQLWKTEAFEQVTVIDGVPTPLRIRMQDLQQGRTTELQVSEIRFDVDLPDALFQPQRLHEAAISPLWQPYRTQVAQNTAAAHMTTMQ